MARTQRSAAEYLPGDRPYTLPALREAAAGCEGCDLYRGVTQTVFGDGPAEATLMLVGEAPGATEDREGRPFIGRAGQLLNDLLEEAGVDRGQVYISNVVKHFPHSGERRPTPRKPKVTEVRACLPWLEAEVSVVKPRVLVCLGASAAQALIGKDFKLTQQRGEVFETPWAPATLATFHPSAVLRRGQANAGESRDQLAADLRKAAELAR